MKFVTTKNSMIQIFFSSLSFLLLFMDPGSGMGKNQDPESGINIPDLQHKPYHYLALVRYAYFLPKTPTVHRNNYRYGMTSANVPVIM